MRRSHCLGRLSASILILFVLMGGAASRRAFAREDRHSEAVLFDVPALLEAREVILEDQPVSASHKLIVVNIPVTSEISRSEQGNIHAFRFDVFWNRNPYPLCDYAPRTQTFSEIVGPIAVDKTTEKSSSFDLKLSGTYPPLASGSILTEGKNRETLNLRYSEIPKHEVLVASGTVRRGTGAFFRFHPSRAETLEGGRDLLVTFKVPQAWRGGLLQVECTAVGNRRSFAWNESFEVKRAFIVPIYLEQDDAAEQSAMDLVHREQSLRQSWQRFQTTASQAKSTAIPMNGLLSFSARSASTPVLPEDWVHALIQVSDQPLERYRDRLPLDVAEAASKFVESRASLLELSR
jgi:hypothetical protein